MNFGRIIRNLSIRKKVSVIVIVFAAAILGVSGVSYLSTRLQSIVRAYVGGEGLWSKGQKDALHHLLMYADSHQPQEYKLFLKALDVPLGDRQAREELQKKIVDYRISDAGFIRGENRPDEVRDMGLFFRYLGWISYIDNAIRIWTEGDRLIESFLEVAEEFHKKVETHSFRQKEKQDYFRRINEISDRLTHLESEFSKTLVIAARWLRGLLAWVNFLATFGFLSLASFLSYFIYRDIQESIEELKLGTTRIGQGDFSQPIKIFANDELGQLATSFNQMMESLLKVTQERNDANHQVVKRANELSDANQKLVEHEKIKSEFFSNISHELRTPLSLILAPLESFLAGEYGEINPKSKSVFETIHNNTIRLLQMVQGLLDFQKLEAKKVEVHRYPTDIAKLTQSVFSDFQSLIKRKGLEGRVTTLPSKANAVVQMDRYIYERILFNLISNAIKFTPSGGKIELSVDTTENTLTISLKDTGIGITAEDQKFLFQKFKQIEGASTRRFEGSGLGLALVKEFSELLGGTVRLESKPGAGSTFTVTCLAPLVPQQETIENQIFDNERPRISFIEKSVGLADEPATTDSPNHKFDRTNTDPQRHKILIVEDNVELANYISSLIKSYSQVKIAHDGEEGLALAREWMPSLILSDIMMPKRDGLSLCKELKSRPETRRISFVILTALTYREALLRGWDAGADDYLFKPFHPSELMARVKSILANQDIIAEYKKARQKAEQEVSEMNRQLIQSRASLLEAQVISHLGSWEWDLKSNKVTWSEELFHILGLDPEKDLPSYETYTKMIHPDDLNYSSKDAERAIQERRSFSQEYRLVLPNGATKIISAKGRVILDETGQATRLLGTVQDITERREIESKMVLMDRMASLGTLAGGVAHEINNPLAYVLLNQELISKRITELKIERPDIDFKELEKCVTEAIDGANRIDGIVKDLKNITRNSENELAPVNIHEVIESSIKMAWNEIRHRAQLIKNFSEVPLVHGNKSRLVQVFINLLVNAAQAIPEGHADSNEIRIATRKYGTDQILIEITDTGQGIPRENLSRIFNPFFTTKPIGQGSGLGLAICHEILRNSGGEIKVDSEVGKGTTFRITLQPNRKDLTTLSPIDESPIPQTLPRSKILIIDDEPLVTAALERLLGKDHDVTVAHSGDEALKKIHSGISYDVILCDLMMPKITGIEIFQELVKTSPENAERIIFLTGGAFSRDADKFLAKTTNLVLEKPFKVDNLLAILKQFLSDRNSRRDPLAKK